MMFNYERLTVDTGAWKCAPVHCHDKDGDLIECHMVEFYTTYDKIKLSQLKRIDPNITREMIEIIGDMFYKGIILGAEHYPVYRDSRLREMREKKSKTKKV